jgi:hypothetical protein
MHDISPSAKELLESMLNIENTPRTVENIRSTSLAMRRLSTLSTSEHDEILIPFCFGLLTVNFAPLWNDACAALKVVAGRSGAKVWELAFSHLSNEMNEESEDAEKPETTALGYESFTEKVWDESQQNSTTRLQHLYNTVFSSAI